MTNEDKKIFIENYLDSFKEDMLKKIDAGKVPEDWDGIEIREWVADSTREQAYYFTGKKRDKRYQDYKNYYIVNNL